MITLVYIEEFYYNLVTTPQFFQSSLSRYDFCTEQIGEILKFVLNKIRKEKVSLDKDFYVFTGSTVGVVPIHGKGIYEGKIEKLGSVKALIN